jgi:predicted secreted hydrolase
VALLLAGCAGSPILANPPIVRPVPSPTEPPASRPPDPRPVSLPRDDGPHDRLTEWWYFTGHLASTDGRRFGFEFVIFRAERGRFPVTWASHLALTDEAGDRFVYAQRSEIGPQVDVTAETSGADFAFGLAGGDPTRPGAMVGSPWRMSRVDGQTTLTASAGPAEATLGGRAAGADAGPSFAIALSLADSRAVLHDGDGWIDFGPAGGSYYYSRPRQPATGTITIDGTPLSVTGSAWFDHQWGDFISVGGGGWDWFAINLDDRTDLTLSLVRAADGSYPLVYGTLVDADATVTHLPASAFTVTVDGTWTSPRTGATYPAGWTVDVPAEALKVTLRPTVAAQELDTRPTTGVTYWEGSQRVSASHLGANVSGQAYVELTGYAPAGP